MNLDRFLLWLGIGVTVSALVGAGLREARRPPTYAEQWERVYVVCARNGGDQTEARRAQCIAAADRAMQCAKEQKP